MREPFHSVKSNMPQGCRLRLSLVRSLSLALVIGALAPLSSAQWAGSEPPKPELKKGFNAISIKDAQSWLGYLAGPPCEGRGTGQPGFQKAMEFMADHFKKMGLKPLGDNGGYFQYNDFYRSRVKLDTLRIQTDAGKLSVDQIGVESSAAAKLWNEPVFVYVGADPKDLVLGDQVKGKTVVLGYNKVYPRLMFQLMRAGAAAIINLSSESKDPITWRVTQREPSIEPGTPRFQLGAAELSKLLVDSDQKVVTDAMSAKTTVVAPLKTRLLIRSEIEVEKVKVANVIALLEGSDPVLKNEYVGVGGHLDHLGRRGNTIYYGADDDGSGSTALLCVAKALTSNRQKPKRSTVFMAFYGEEMGLLGSSFLVSKPPVPLDKMVAELQMDMVGRNSEGEQRPGQIDDPKKNEDTIRLVGSKRISTELDSIIQAQNVHLGFKFLYDAEDVYTRSDHYNFARNGVPIAFFFDGFHPDYHQPTDTVDKINFEKLTNVAKLVYLTIHEVGSKDKPLVKDVTKK